MAKHTLSKDDKLFNDSRVNYKIGKEPYHGSMRLGVSRRNKNGYWNFISYIDSEDEFKSVVIADIKQCSVDKRKKVVVDDEDI